MTSPSCEQPSKSKKHIVSTHARPWHSHTRFPTKQKTSSRAACVPKKTHKLQTRFSRTRRQLLNHLAIEKIAEERFLLAPLPLRVGYPLLNSEIVGQEG